MGILARSIGFSNLSLESPSTPLLPYSSLIEGLGLGRSDAGMVVNEWQSRRLAAVYSSWNIISSDLSRLPLLVFQNMPDGSILELPDSKWYYLLKHEPNPKMTSMTFRAALIVSLLGYGNGYAYLQRDAAKRVVAMYPLPPDKTSPILIDGKLIYATTQTADGRAEYIQPADMLHVMGLSMDGYVGLSPIRCCMNTFGLADAAESYGARFFANGARASGVLTHPATLGTEAYDNLKRSLREVLSGKNALSPFILEEGMKWEQVSIPPNEAQFLETRKFQEQQIQSAIYRIPAHLYGELGRSTNNNIEHQGLDYVRYCLAPWAVRLEQEIQRKLFGNAPYFAEHDFSELQRGDVATQSAAHQIYRNIGVFSTNDVLRDLRMNPISKEDGGDVRTIQGAMLPLQQYVNWQGGAPGSGGNANTGNDPLGNPPKQKGATAAYQRLFRDAVGRVTNRSQRDPATVKAIFIPILTSFAETLSAVRFGIAGVTKGEHEVISGYVEQLAEQAGAWTKTDIASAAERITNEAYEVLTKC